MNSILLSNRHIDINKEEFIKMWNNSGYTLEPLYKTLLVLKEEISSIKKDDFDCPNHYAKLAFNMGQIKTIDFIIDLLPKTAKE